MRDEIIIVVTKKWNQLIRGKNRKQCLLFQTKYIVIIAKRQTDAQHVEKYKRSVRNVVVPNTGIGVTIVIPIDVVAGEEDLGLVDISKYIV